MKFNPGTIAAIIANTVIVTFVAFVPHCHAQNTTAGIPNDVVDAILANGTPNPMEKRLVHSHIECPFPLDSNEIVQVTPQFLNKGWANSYDRPCTANLWCQYACKPGTVMHQWNPVAVDYVDPWKEQGGLFCGDEAMRIPNFIPAGTTALLAIPGVEYWSEMKPTGAHYYINSPNVPVDEACVWGTNAKGAGNWAPYSFGTNEREDGEIFVSLNWNPIWFETTTPFRSERPEFGVRLECEGPNWNNAPCFIDPRIHAVNQVSYTQGFVGAGDANACVVTAGKDSQIKVVLF
ncbi:hypothetical protein FPQ18DRAFT_377920 [Pyronema domesticum]|nr:hypothetical protein FPQ18DRAFT_377920 [Pyronema domesticum]